MYHNSFRDGVPPSSLDRPFTRERLSSTTSCSSMSSRSGGAAGASWGNNRGGGGLASAPQHRRPQHQRPGSPSYQHRNSNVSLSSSGSQQGSPGPSSARSITTSGIGSDRYSITSRELDSSERRSLNSSPKGTYKNRQIATYQRPHSGSSASQRQSDRNCTPRGSNSGNAFYGVNRSPVSNPNSTKQMSPSTLCSSPNRMTTSGAVAVTLSDHMDRNASSIPKSGSSCNDNGVIQSKVSFSTTTSTNTTSRQQTSMQQSRWQKLFSTFKKNKHGGNGNFGAHSHGSASAHSDDAFSLKHSHNCSNSFLKAGISNMKGYKKANQDRCTAFSYLEGDPDLAYFAVYDGHGGTGVANYLKDHLHEFILDQPEYKKGNMEEAVHKAFLKVDGELRTYGSATELTGSTATVIMIKHGDLLCANLGDSRATAQVIGGVKTLSQDHNTSNAKERERVYSMGGTIKDNRVGGVLIPTRSFGDFLLKSEQDKPAWKQVISVVPQIQFFKLDTHWEFVVVGSDGVWDAMSNMEMSNYIKARLGNYTNPHGKERDKFLLSDLCEQILDACCAKTVSHYGKNSCDNMTIIIIWFDHGYIGTAMSETGSSVVSSSGVSSASR